MGRILLRCSRSAHNVCRKFRGLCRPGPTVRKPDILPRTSATLSVDPFALNRRMAACVKLLHADANVARRPTPEWPPVLRRLQLLCLDRSNWGQVRA